MLQLANFRLVTDHSFAIEIEAFGVIWNMHHFSDFEGFSYSVRERTAKLSWHFLATDGPTIPKFPAERIDIVFHNVDYFEVSPRDSEMPQDEDINFDTVSFIEESENSQDYLHNSLIPCFYPALSHNNEQYHILFRFHGGQMIRIGAERAEFVLV